MTESGQAELGATRSPAASGGEVLTVGAVATILVAMAVSYLRRENLTAQDAFFGATVALTCAQLFLGSSWAKWVIGVFLIFIGCVSIFATLKYLPASLNPLVNPWAPLGVAALGFGLVLLISTRARYFLLRQRSKTLPVPRRTLKFLWWGVLAGYVIFIIFDVNHNFSR